MSETTAPAGSAAAAGPTLPTPAAEAAPTPKRRLGGGAIAAIIAGGVLSVALVFGAGFATASIVSPFGFGGPGSSFGGGQPPQFGGGGPSQEQGVPGQRRDDTESDSGSSSGSSST